MKILLTGVTGFAGTKLAEHILANTTWDIYSLERITARPSTLSHDRVHRLHHDFRAPLPDRIIDALAGTRYVVHVGAEVHGLRSLENPELFVHSNAMGTFHMLEAARKLKPEKFLYISSAEAVGSAPIGISWGEDCVLRPSNPYAAAKAAGEMLCRAYHLSFGMPVNIVRTMNIFGPQQDTSKFVPSVIKKMLAGEVIPLHVDAQGNSGSRCWLHIREFIRAIDYLLKTDTRVGETYHVVGPEATNSFIIATLGLALAAAWREKLTVPGASHDMRYAIQDTKLLGIYDASIGQMQQDLRFTAQAYKAHQEWLQ